MVVASIVAASRPVCGCSSTGSLPAGVGAIESGTGSTAPSRALGSPSLAACRRCGAAPSSPAAGSDLPRIPCCSGGTSLSSRWASRTSRSGLLPVAASSRCPSGPPRAAGRRSRARPTTAPGPRRRPRPRATWPASSPRCAGRRPRASPPTAAAGAGRRRRRAARPWCRWRPRRLVKENSNSFVSVIASVGHASTHRSQWMQRR